VVDENTGRGQPTITTVVSGASAHGKGTAFKAPLAAVAVVTGTPPDRPKRDGWANTVDQPRTGTPAYGFARSKARALVVVAGHHHHVHLVLSIQYAISWANSKRDFGRLIAVHGLPRPSCPQVRRADWSGIRHRRIRHC